jgi:hypothetical protein
MDITPSERRQDKINKMSLLLAVQAEGHLTPCKFMSERLGFTELPKSDALRLSVIPQKGSSVELKTGLIFDALVGEDFVERGGFRR